MAEPRKGTPKKSLKTGTKKEVLVLLDSHAILHRAYHALPEFTTSDGTPTGALYGYVTMILSIIESFKPTYIAACFDLPAPTHRHVAFVDYKAHRQKTDDALISQIIAARDVARAFGIEVFEDAGFEADDLLGTIVEKTSKNKNLQTIIASGDMDTMQLVRDKSVQVFTLKKGIKDTITYDEDGVRARFGFAPTLLPDYKGLRGDPSDNIPGVHGIGEKTATSLITAFGTIEQLYEALKKDPVEAGKKAGVSERIVKLLQDSEDGARFSKMLATIRTDAPIDFDLERARWNIGINEEKAKEICRKYEFRSIIPRLQKFIHPGSVAANATSIGNSAEGEKLHHSDKGSTEVLYAEPSSPEAEEENNIAQQEIDADPELVRRAAVALWITKSESINAGVQEILEETGESTVEAALEKLEKQIHAEPDLDRVYREIELPLLPVIQKMHEDGICINVAKFTELSTKYHEELSALEKKIHELAGEDFNINSPRQLGQILYTKLGLGVKVKKTAGGAQSTKESELEKIKDAHEIVPHILEYRELQKLLSTYIDVIPKLISEDGRLRTTFVPNGAATGRMSSQNPNLQNIPIKSGRGRAIRDAFVAADGYVLLECDYSQIELRVAAFLSGDEKLMNIFRDRRDVHTEVAAQVFHVPSEEVTKDMRRKAKVINFGILYGMGVNALKANLGSTRAEAQEFYDAYFKTFSRLAEYLEEVKKEASKKGYTTTFFGRRRHFSGLRSPLPFIRASAERMAINAPIQGTESDIIKMAMVNVFNEISKAGKSDDVRMLLQIHDSLIFEVKESMIKEKAADIMRLMTSAISETDTKGVPIEVNGAYGKDWGSLKEIEK